MTKAAMILVLLCYINPCHAQEELIDIPNRNGVEFSSSVGLFIGGEKNATYTELASIGVNISLPLARQIFVRPGACYKFSTSNNNFRLAEYEVNIGATRYCKLRKYALYYGLAVGLLYSHESYAFSFYEQNIEGSFNHVGYLFRPHFGVQFQHFSFGPHLEIEPNAKTVISFEIRYLLSI